MASASKSLQLLFLRCVWLIGEAQMNKNTVIAVNFRRAQRLAIHRDKPLADLAGALCDKLLKPCAQIVNPRRRNESDFVSTEISERSENCAQDRSGVLIGGNLRLAGLDHFIGALKKFAEIEPHDG